MKERPPRLTRFERAAAFIRDWHIVSVLLLAIILVSLISGRLAEQTLTVELIGVLLLFFLLETFTRARSRSERIKEQTRRDTELRVLQMQVTNEIRQELRNYIQNQETARLRAARSMEERQPILDSMRLAGLLKGADLYGTVLEGTQLQQAELQGAVLRKAALKEADLREADLKQADLWQANLEGAQLTSADLEQANLYMANLRRADLQQANLHEANMGQADLRESDLGNARLEAANLWDANLTRADLEEADLRGAVMVEANLERALLWQANLKGAILLKANLADADLTHTNLLGARFVTVEQLQDKYLRSVTLPDGKRLPDDESWRDAFQNWLNSTQTDEDGFIVPTYAGIDLTGQTRFTIKYLRKAISLQGAILPDGTPLPQNDDWRLAFDHWAQTVKVDQYGHVQPTNTIQQLM